MGTPVHDAATSVVVLLLANLSIPHTALMSTSGHNLFPEGRVSPSVELSITTSISVVRGRQQRGGYDLRGSFSFTSAAELGPPYWTAPLPALDPGSDTADQYSDTCHHITCRNPYVAT